MPIRCQGPEGPLGKPTFPKDEACNAFWLESAERMFKAAREIIELIEICGKKDKLPRSILVLFATWTASLVALYALHFPHMDPERHIIGHTWNESGESEMTVFQHGPTGLTYHALEKMSPWLKMATTYIGVLQQLDTYFSKVQKDFQKHVESSRVLSDMAQLTLRLAGQYSAPEDYNRGPLLKDFGTLHPNELGHVDGFDQSLGSTLDLGPPTAQSKLSHRSARVLPRWAHSVNHVPMSTSLAVQSETSGLTGPKAEGAPDPRNECQREHWSQHLAPLRPEQSPSQSHLSDGLADSATTAVQAMNYTIPQYEIDREESRRFNVINDLGILTQTSDPWIGMPAPSVMLFSALPSVAARVFRTSRPVQKSACKLNHARDTGQGTAGRPLRCQTPHGERTSAQFTTVWTGYPPSTKDNGGISAVQHGAQTTHPPSYRVAQGSLTESLMMSVDHGSSVYDVMAGNAVAGTANGFEFASAAIGNGIVATAGGPPPTTLEPGQCQSEGGQAMCDSSADVSPNAESEDIDLHQGMEGLHHGDRDAGHPLAEMPDIPSTTLTQEVDAGDHATERSWHLQRHAKTSLGYILM